MTWGGDPVTPLRRTASIAGWLFIATFVTSIPAQLIFYAPVLGDANANYVTGAGADAHASVAMGALLEVLLIIANIGTAIVLFPILKRQNETLSLGYVAARIIESTFIAIGLLSLLAILTVREDVVGANVAFGRSLVAIHDWTFLLGPGWVVGVGNGLILGCLMYSSGLVPRGMTWLGLVGGPLIIISGTAVLFDVIEPASTAQVVATIPEFFWELSLGFYLIIKGFKPSPVTAGLEPPATAASM